MSTFDDQTIYLKHNDGNDDCGCGSGCCSCCPTGLVSVQGSCGKDIGCLTPNDASLYQIESHIPEINLVKTFDPRTGDYVGDMSSADSITYITFLLTLPPELKLNLVTTAVLCNGDSTGTSAVTVSGGTAPYVITWGGDDPALLAAGSHIVDVVDNVGISKSQTFIISEPPVLAATSSSTPDSGATDGTATVVPTGGVPPYTFLWDDPGAQTTATAVGLAAGNFNCTITDANGCILIEGPIVVS